MRHCHYKTSSQPPLPPILLSSLYPQDTVIYSALCPRLGGQCVVVKVYDRATLQASERGGPGLG